MDKRVALVTGASRGIGAAIAVRLARDGFNVALTCLKGVERAEEVAAECRALGAETLVLSGDCADPVVCRGWVEKTIEKFGKIDALINNAGITRDGLLMRMGDEQFESVLAANLNSAFYLTREVSRPMMKARYGRIINISSVAGVYGNAGQANYSASKAGLIGLTKAAAKELGGRGITVNAVAPGAIETDMTEALPEKVRAGMLERIALGRMGSAGEVAAAVAFLASEDSAYVTGQVLQVDGGIAM